MKNPDLPMWLKSSCPRCGKVMPPLVVVPEQIKVLSHCTGGCGYTQMGTVDPIKRMWQIDKGLFMSLDLTEQIVAALLNVQSVLHLTRAGVLIPEVGVNNALLVIQEVQSLIEVVISDNQELAEFYQLSI